jgi:penicillin amidase
MDDITPQDMQEMQMDNYSYYAEILLPSLISWTKEDNLTDLEREILSVMKDWNYMMEGEQVAPSIFRLWSGNFYRAVLYDEYRTTDAVLRYPSRDRFVEVVKNEADFVFIDDVDTEQIETREDIALSSFKETVSELIEDLGEYGDKWKWGYYINNDVDHLASIPGLGRQNLFSSGSSEAINATRDSWGPSWRMVVEVGPEVKGYGVYPGGASGNPGSENYDSMIESWRTGELFELNFMKEEPKEYLYKLELR